MRRLLILLLLVSAAFAGKGKKLEQLSEENTALNMRIQELTSAVNMLERDTATLNGKIVELEKKNNDLAQTVKEKDLLVEQYKKQIRKLQTVSSGTSSTTTTTTVGVNRQVPVLKYPITGKLMDKKNHDASSQACRIIFYNGSAQDLLGFTANVRFVSGGQVLTDCIVDVTERSSSGENVSWYGAIPYDLTDPNSALFYNTVADRIDVIVEVHSITTTSGVVKNFLK